MKFWYPASIAQITSINDSFDSCILSVCYAGRNRNNTIISKEAIESAMATMSYCPIVANYDIDTDTIGGHDVGFTETSDGSIKMVNLTDAVGVIPENPQWCWQKKVDDDGVEREYLTTPAILWKRTPVYSKLKRDGVSGQSMEINVKNGKVVDGLFEIDAFEFTAFCLLGDDIEPCFEGAQVEMFSLESLSKRLSEMMDEFKNNYTKVIAASADDDITPSGENYKLEGGNSSLNIDEMLQKFGLTVDDITFEIDGLSEEEIENRFAELKQAKFNDESSDAGDEVDAGEAGESGNESGDSHNNDTADADGNDESVSVDEGCQFSLTGEQMRNEILDALRSVKYSDEWGEWPRYCFMDYDLSVNEVYAYDNDDWNLYGLKFAMNGDNIVIDFDSAKRKKLAFIDFDEGESQFNYQHMLDGANARFEKVAGEVASLREFKLNIERADRKAKEDEVFSRFIDLAEDERFKALREDCGDMTIQDIEDKCYAIRGRNMQIKFSQQEGQAPIRIPVERMNNADDSDEPYGGVFVKYGIANR